MQGKCSPDVKVDSNRCEYHYFCVTVLWNWEWSPYSDCLEVAKDTWFLGRRDGVIVGLGFSTCH